MDKDNPLHPAVEMARYQSEQILDLHQQITAVTITLSVIFSAVQRRDPDFANECRKNLENVFAKIKTDDWSDRAKSLIQLLQNSLVEQKNEQ